MAVSRSTSRLSALLGAILGLVAIGVAVPASAAPSVTIDAIPGAPLLTPAAGPVTLVLSGDAAAGTEVTIATDDIPSGVVTPICGPVTAGSDNRWTCTATDVADWVGRLRADVFASPVYSTPVSVIAAPTLTGTPVSGTDLTPTISGTVPAGGVSTAVAVTVEGAPACISTVAPGATWSCEVPTGLITVDGAYEIGATQTKDFGGGESRTSIATTTDYVLDTTGPTAAAEFTSPASSPLSTPSPALSLAGTAEAGGSVTVMAGTTVLCANVTVTGVGAWSCTAMLASAGTHTLSIVQKDAVGNAASVPSETVVVTYTPPVAAPPTASAPPTAGGGNAAAIQAALNAQLREVVERLAAQALEDLCRELTGLIGTIPIDDDILDQFDCPDASVPVEGTLNLTLPAASNEITWSATLNSEPTLLGSGSLDPDAPTTVELTIPASVPAGDHQLELVLVDGAYPALAPVSVRMPITLVPAEPEPVATREADASPEPEAAAADDPGMGAWPWVILALAVAAVIATSVLLVRRGRSGVS